MKKSIQKSILRRLHIIEGQVRGLAKMVEKEKYCVDVINQSSAIRHALSKVEDLLLENHLCTHVVEQFKSGQQKKAIAEIININKLSKKNNS